MAAHVPIPWVMGYDLHPLTSMQEKRTLLAQAFARSGSLGARARSFLWSREGETGRRRFSPPGLSRVD